MLLQFSVGNFRSFGQTQVLSFVASKQKSRDRSLDDRVRRPVKGGLHALTSAAVFGPNASGKSNLFKALHFFRVFVLDSARDGQAEDPIQVVPFRLSPELADKPSNFEIVFEIDETRYRYGFEADQRRIRSEWLYRTEQRESLLFERDDDAFAGVKLMDLDELGPRTRSNALFLSVAAQFNHPLATELVKWVRQMGFVEGLRDSNLGYTAALLADETEHADAVRDLLAGLDLSVSDVQVSRRADPDMPSGIKPRLYEHLFPHRAFQITTRHTQLDAEGNPVGEVDFELQDESDGTQKVFGLAGPLVDTLRRGGVMVVDEFDARLHPLLGRRILQLFNEPESNPHGAQLLIMTHDTTTLDLDRMRRDQLWFVEKDLQGQSELYSLSEFRKPVRNDAAVQKAYLQGRYGATPRLRVHPEVLLGTGS